MVITHYRTAATTLLAAVITILPGGCTNADRSQTAVDVDGRPVDPLVEAGTAPTVLLFVQTTCPISNRYAPDIRKLHATYSPRGVRFYLVYIDPDETVELIRQHLNEYDLPGKALRDTNHVLVRKTGVTVTPEAAVYDTRRDMVYRGRIDDRNVDFGKLRVAATQADLQIAIEAVVAGEPLKPHTTSAVGCYIKDLTKP